MYAKEHAESRMISGCVFLHRLGSTPGVTRETTCKSGGQGVFSYCGESRLRERDLRQLVPRKTSRHFAMDKRRVGVDARGDNELSLDDFAVEPAARDLPRELGRKGW